MQLSVSRRGTPAERPLVSVSLESPGFSAKIEANIPYAIVKQTYEWPESKTPTLLGSSQNLPTTSPWATRAKARG